MNVMILPKEVAGILFNGEENPQTFQTCCVPIAYPDGFRPVVVKYLYQPTTDTVFLIDEDNLSSPFDVASGLHHDTHIRYIASVCMMQRVRMMS